MNIASNPILQLIQQSDAVTWFVLIVLLIMSIVCWGIFFYKFFLMRTKQQQLDEALHLLREVQTFDELRAVIAAINHTFPGYFLKKNLVYIKSLLEKHADSPVLTANDLELLQQHVEQMIDEMIHWQESYLPILFSCASVSPLLGLFGTVWGLVHAFVRIAQKQSADIATVAPGIAEALITTLAGLIVAIPAFIMYHYLSTKVRALEHSLLNVANTFLMIIQNFV